jgi:hypothetical protein
MTSWALPADHDQQNMNTGSMSAAVDETTTARPTQSARSQELIFEELTFEEPMSGIKRAQLSP